MRIVQEIQIWLLEDLMNLIMGQFIMASGIKKDRGKEKESRFGRMEPNMKAIGNLIKLMAMADSFIPMETVIMENGLMIRLMEEAVMIILMEQHIQEIGKKINSMAME